MNFNEYFYLAEEVKRTDIIDTYVLMSMPDIDDPAAQFVKKEIMDQARSNITQELTHIILRELRHADSEGKLGEILDDFVRADNDIKDGLALRDFDYSDIFRGAKKISEILNLQPPRSSKYVADNLKMYIRNTKQLLSAIKYNKNNINKLSLNTAYKCFKVLPWSRLYGGTSWSEITAHTIKIINAKTPMEFFKLLDRLIDFVHNTGSILTKFKGYEEGWIQFILDIKEKAVNIRELIPHTSQEVRKMFASPEWRTFIKKIPGEGAETSFESYKQMLPKYIKNIAITIDGDPEAGFADVVRYAGAVGETILKIGKKRAEEFIKDLPVNTIVNAALAAQAFLQNLPDSDVKSKPAKQGSSFIRSYAEINYPDAYENAVLDSGMI